MGITIICTINDFTYYLQRESGCNRSKYELWKRQGNSNRQKVASIVKIVSENWRGHREVYKTSTSPSLLSCLDVYEVEALDEALEYLNKMFGVS